MRFAALQPVYDAVIDRWGQLGPDVARGLGLRHDLGPQHRSAHFTSSLAWLARVGTVAVDPWRGYATARGRARLRARTGRW